MLIADREISLLDHTKIRTRNKIVLLVLNISYTVNMLIISLSALPHVMPGRRYTMIVM